MNDSAIEVWLRMYDEQVRQARHHETSRTNSTRIIMTISAAIFAFLTHQYQQLTGLPSVYIGLLLCVINLHGALLSLKHYERNRFHTTIAGKYRNVLSRHSVLAGKRIDDERETARTEHKRKGYMTEPWRLYRLWCCIHFLAAFVGLFILAYGLRQHACQS